MEGEMPASNIRTIWTRIERVLECHVPETAATLAPPATEDEIAEAETATGLKFPTDLIASLKIHNGQNDPSCCHSFINEGLLASTQQIAETWRMLSDLEEEFHQSDQNWNALEHDEWWNRHWIPFTYGDGDCLCVNLNPHVRTGGQFGEIVCHIHDNPHEAGIALSYSEWLGNLARRLENHEFNIDEHGFLTLNTP